MTEMPKVDDKFKSLIPPLSDEERQQLEQNLLAEGCRDALVLWAGHGVLLDGHNRLQICTQHNIPFRTIEIELPDREAAADWIDANQLGRRNLTPDAFRLLLGRRYNRTKKESGVRGPSKKLAQFEQAFSSTADKLALEHGVSRETVKRAGKFAEDIEKNPNLQKAIIQKIPIAQARREERKQKHVERIEAAAAKPEKKQPGWNITSDESVVECVALIADPPYGILTEPWEPQELEAFTREWASRWNGCKAEIVLVFWSQRHLWLGRSWLDQSLTGYSFQQLLIWHYPNNKSPQSRDGFKQTWEPIFMYRMKGSTRKVRVHVSNWGEGLNDFDCHVAAVPQSNFNGVDCKLHPAQKPLSVMRWLVAAVTVEGELVCDPFCGSGTTGVACLQLNRRFHGIEKDEDFRRMATGRLNEYGAA